MKKEKISSENLKVLRERKKLEDLEFFDNFIFTRVMLDRRLCAEIVSAFLD